MKRSLLLAALAAAAPAARRGPGPRARSTSRASSTASRSRSTGSSARNGRSPRSPSSRPTARWRGCGRGSRSASTGSCSAWAATSSTAARRTPSSLPDACPCSATTTTRATPASTSPSCARSRSAWLRLHAGRFAMPVRLTEMIWDRDLRPQGAAVTLQATDRGPFKRLAAHRPRRARQPRVPRRRAPLISPTARRCGSRPPPPLAGVGERATVELLGVVRDLRRPRVRRSAPAPPEHPRVARRPAGPRLRRGGPRRALQPRGARGGPARGRLLLEHGRGRRTTRGCGWPRCWARRARRPRPSSTRTRRWIPDATLAAFAADDFLWETGWEGHRADLGIRLPRALRPARAWPSCQRFKDAPQPAERDAGWTATASRCGSGTRAWPRAQAGQDLRPRRGGGPTALSGVTDTIEPLSSRTTDDS